MTLNESVRAATVASRSAATVMQVERVVPCYCWKSADDGTVFCKSPSVLALPSSASALAAF